MKWIEPYIASKDFTTFQQNIDLIDKSNDYRSWLGFNFVNQNLYSIKFYYTFYQILEKPDIERLFVLGDSADYYKAFEKVALSEVLNISDAGSGFTFTLKLNHKLEPTFGFYLKQNFGPTDPFFELPESKLFFEQGGKTEALDMAKNFSVFYDAKGGKKEKSYYYIRDKKYKEIISSIFDEQDLKDVPIIEYAVGSGHRENTEYNLANRKAILFGDFKKYSDLYLQKWKALNHYFEDIKKQGFQLYCPALYGDKNCTSIYAFDFKNKSTLIENLVLNKLKKF